MVKKITFLSLILITNIFAKYYRIFNSDFINYSITKFNKNNISQIYPILNKNNPEINKFSKIPYNNFYYKDSNLICGASGVIGGNTIHLTKKEEKSPFGIKMFYKGIIYASYKNLTIDARFQNNEEIYTEKIIQAWDKNNYSTPFYGTDSKNLSGNNTNKKIYDNNYLHLIYNFNKNDYIEIGHDKLSIGPQFFSSLSICDSSNPYDYYLVEKKLPKNLTFSFGVLDLVSDTGLVSKKLAFHKLSWFYKFINISLYENVIFANRTPMMYVVPILPFFVAEHYYGDLDNKAMGSDITFYFKGFKLFGSLILDDLYSLSPNSFLSDDWWGNKWATSYGLGYNHYFKNSYFANLAIEFNHIEPWVYTHTNRIINYTHYGKELGAPNGSDSKSMRVEGNIGKLSKFNFSIFYYTYKKGNILTSDVHAYSIDGDNKKFLEYISDEDNIIGIKNRYNFSIKKFNFNPFININYSLKRYSSLMEIGFEFSY